MASLSAIKKQVDREGARWGLVGVIKEGCVKVCEMVAELPQRPLGAPIVVTQTERPICSLDENSPLDAFAGVLLHRLKREHHDFMKLVVNRQKRLRAEGEAELDLRRKDLRAKLMHIATARVVSTGIMR